MITQILILLYQTFKSILGIRRPEQLVNFVFYICLLLLFLILHRSFFRVFRFDNWMIWDFVFYYISHFNSFLVILFLAFFVHRFLVIFLTRFISLIVRFVTEFLFFDFAKINCRRLLLILRTLHRWTAFDALEVRDQLIGESHGALIRILIFLGMIHVNISLKLWPVPQSRRTGIRLFLLICLP